MKFDAKIGETEMEKKILFAINEDWLALHREDAMEPAMPIVDPHHHLWDRGSRYLLDELAKLAVEFPELVLDVRGRGLMCAFSMPTGEQRDELIRKLWDRQVIMLASGPNSVRFRPALTVSRDEIDAAVAAVREALS